MAREMTEEEERLRKTILSEVVLVDRAIRWREMKVLNRDVEDRRCFHGTVSLYALMVYSLPATPDRDVRAIGTIRDDIGGVLVVLNDDFATHLWKFARRYVDEGWRGEYE